MTKTTKPTIPIITKTLLITVCFVLVSFALLETWLLSKSARQFRANLKTTLLNQLVRTNQTDSDQIADAIYILGGSQKSLELKFKAAGGLFQTKQIEKILVLSMRGVTEYNSSLGRNMTFDEWSTMKLIQYGVPGGHIEFQKLKEGFFGTLSEARGVALLAEKRQYKTIILIAAGYHTHRVKVSFEHYFKTNDTALIRYGSHENVRLKTLIVEFIKLKIYQHFLIKLPVPTLEQLNNFLTVSLHKNSPLNIA